MRAIRRPLLLVGRWRVGAGARRRPLLYGAPYLGLMDLSGLDGAEFSVTKAFVLGGARTAETYGSEIDGVILGATATSDTATNPAAALSVARLGPVGVNSTSRGYAMGGAVSPSETDSSEIDGLDTVNETAINPAATLGTARQRGAGVNSRARGYVLGGVTGGTTPSAEIDAIEFASETGVNPSAALAVAVLRAAGVNSAIRGYTLGGFTTVPIDDILGLDFRDETAINPAAAISIARHSQAGVNSRRRGYLLSGRDVSGSYPTGFYDEIDGLDLQTEAAINPAAAIGVPRFSSTGAQNLYRGYALGGFTDADVAVVDGLTFDTETAVTSSVTLGTARHSGAGINRSVNL